MSMIYIVKSSRKNKKYNAYSDDGLNVHFGDSRYKDFTETNDAHKRDLYLKRHCKREDWSNEKKAAFWSVHFLWHKKSKEEAAKFISQMLNRKVVLYI